jgi:purine-nucleoside phosphorylase
MGQKAAEIAGIVTNMLNLNYASKPVGVILGTGWGDKLVIENSKESFLDRLPGFETLGSLEGHARKYMFGRLGQQEVLALSGRIHLNEHPSDPRLPDMVRLQTEVMLQLGVKKFIVTCAARSLPGSNLETGSIVIMDGFVTVFAPPMPLYAGEFCSPEDSLTSELLNVAVDCRRHYDGPVCTGGYAMVRGPFFEGLRYDKNVLAATGAKIVGMSTLPEACVCALYPGVQMLGLAFVTNGDSEVHSHEVNIERAKKSAEGLSNYLNHLIAAIGVL